MPAIVPVLFTANEIVAVPVPADISSVPALLKAVLVSPLEFRPPPPVWKSKVAPASLLIVVPAASALDCVGAGDDDGSGAGVVQRSGKAHARPLPEIVSVPALVMVPARLESNSDHCKTLPVKSSVAPLAPAPVNGTSCDLD